VIYCPQEARNTEKLSAENPYKNCWGDAFNRKVVEYEPNPCGASCLNANLQSLQLKENEFYAGRALRKN
jgi:hypothetical protein